MSGLFLVFVFLLLFFFFFGGGEEEEEGIPEDKQTILGRGQEIVKSEVNV